MNNSYDVIVIGAGAAGLMCSIEAGKRGKSVCLIEHSSKIAEKIRISGGGRCNFTNLYSNPSNFLSNNKHFCKSAFAKYTQNDFINLIKKYNIDYYEKKLGQLFCTISAKEIIDMLIAECMAQNVEIIKETKISNLTKSQKSYVIKTNKGIYSCALQVTDLLPALVPLTFEEKELEFCKSLAGVSLNASVKINKTVFNEGLIFTHRGISGPSILQISSYWKTEQPISINLLPELNMNLVLQERRKANPKQNLSNILADYLPNKLAMAICNKLLINKKIGDASNKDLIRMSGFLNNWIVFPKGTEGYKTAEVTLGGVDTKEISSSTMECINHPGLFFIGEVLDVTGHLGGHNFQWAWSSGFLAGQNV